MIRAVAVALTALAMTMPAVAHADEDPTRRGGSGATFDTAHVDVDTDPLLTADALISDDAEAQNTVGGATTCSYESVQSGVNAAPSSPSFQLMYVVPSDVTATSSLDVPRSCSDGSVKYSSIARGSRNGATFQYNQSASLNFRTLAITYTHNFTGAQYSTRGVRRFRSAYTRATWNSWSMRDNPSTRLAKMRDELYANGFRVSNTKYLAVLDAGSQRYTCTSATGCHTLGVAEIGGQYGFTIRYYSGTSPTVYMRYGCATDGDALHLHEATHMLNVNHVGDHAYDVMNAFKQSSVNFNTSPSLIWDHNRNNYHSTVRGSSYVNTAGLAGNYFSC